MPLAFEVVARDGAARRGSLVTDHGSIETPAFMPVGTMGAVKGVEPGALEGLGAEVMLANLYHLTLRPGIDAVEAAGGIHHWCGWRRPILTDSGGYQVFSLAARRTVDTDGVSFQSHVDGAAARFTPESVVRDQYRLGVDIAMMLDECPPWPVDKDEAAQALERTLGWAERARAVHRSAGPTALFGIAQGSVYDDLRLEALERLAGLGFDGYAIGGVSVGEPGEERHRVVELTAARLPADRPRYLMGVGRPADLLHAVVQGFDLFDCVLPSRNARHGFLFTREGVVKIKNARFRDDPRPLDEGCPCPCCRRVTRAFLHHLVRAGELTGAVLSTLHNLRFYLDFMGDLREAIASGTLAETATRLSARYPAEDP